ncbi:hypothetical protein QTP88_010699 [Uroleucon formosanum]
MKISEVGRRKDGRNDATSRRTCTFKYTIDDLEVCHLTFIDTFQITKRRVETIQNKIKNNIDTPIDGRGKHRNRPYAIPNLKNPHAALLYSWPTAESSMRYARRQTLPQLPSTLRELSEYFDQNAEKYNKRVITLSFIRSGVVDNAGKCSVIYASTELHADATFKIVPSTPYCRQLLIIHLILQNHSILICYVLMEAKTKASYRKVMEIFKIKFPDVKPLMIMIDFESALYNVFFMFILKLRFLRSLQKNIKKMGYSGYIKENREAKMCLRMCSVLALLPVYQIEQGFQEVKNYAQTHKFLANEKRPRKLFSAQPSTSNEQQLRKLSFNNEKKFPSHAP